jgi:hypothetical protein
MFGAGTSSRLTNPRFPVVFWARTAGRSNARNAKTAMSACFETIDLPEKTERSLSMDLSARAESSRQMFGNGIHEGAWNAIEYLPSLRSRTFWSGYRIKVGRMLPILPSRLDRPRRPQ